MSDHQSSNHSDSDSTILTNTNKLLSFVGIEGEVSTIEGLVRVSSSLFASVYESLFRVRLPIIRKPESREDYIENCQTVIDGLADQILTDLGHITGEAIVDGDVRSLSNLLHIFLRIASITSADNNYTFAMPPPNIGNSVASNSLSSHDSLFNAPVHHSTESSTYFQKNPHWTHYKDNPNLAKPEISNNPKVRQILSSNECMIRQEERLEAARKRREKLIRLKEANSRQTNNRWQDVSNSARHQRSVENTHRQKEAHMLRKSNEDQIMMHKIYKSLLKKLRDWRVDERAELAERHSLAKQQMLSTVQGLQHLFEDRVRLLREQEKEERACTRHVNAVNSRLGSESCKDIVGSYDDMLNSLSSRVEQRRHHQLMRRSEGYQSMLSLLDSQDWATGLRHSIHNTATSFTHNDL